MKKREELFEDIKREIRYMEKWDIESLLIELENTYDIKNLDTNGLPCNGSTYELYREVEINGFYVKEIVGHLKYFSEIYGGETHLFLFEPYFSGGSALNSYNSHYYIMEKTFNKLGRAIKLSIMD